MCASEPSRSTCDVFAHPSREDSDGRPFYAITRQISGPATRLQVTDLFFRARFAFFIIELKTRRVIHVGVARSPTDPWLARTAARSHPLWANIKDLIYDNDSKFGPWFARVAITNAIEILNTPYHAPRANATCERFLRSVRRERLDHLLILREKQHEPRTQWICRLLQPGTTTSRDSAAST